MVPTKLDMIIGFVVPRDALIFHAARENIFQNYFMDEYCDTLYIFILKRQKEKKKMQFENNEKNI